MHPVAQRVRIPRHQRPRHHRELGPQSKSCPHHRVLSCETNAARVGLPAKSCPPPTPQRSPVPLHVLHWHPWTVPTPSSAIPCRRGTLTSWRGSTWFHGHTAWYALAKGTRVPLARSHCWSTSDPSTRPRSKITWSRGSPSSPALRCWRRHWEVRTGLGLGPLTAHNRAYRVLEAPPACVEVHAWRCRGYGEAHRVRAHARARGCLANDW